MKWKNKKKLWQKKIKSVTSRLPVRRLIAALSLFSIGPNREKLRTCARYAISKNSFLRNEGPLKEKSICVSSKFQGGIYKKLFGRKKLIS